jgi:4,5-DOPA dioxygenase extradiol
LASSSTLPALFIGHGSPMNALEDNAFTRGWRDVAAQIERPRAVLCVSAHWTTRGSYVSGATSPETIHDFYGFPQALFDVRYPAPGDVALARQIAQSVKSTSLQIDPTYGLDHGSWSVLRVMYPSADIPTLQLSIDVTRPGEFHYRVSQELASLRDEGVLVIGSGNIVHNLREFDFRNPTPAPWAVRADTLLREKIAAKDHAQLARWHELGGDVARAVPTPEHYLPLLYILGMQRDGDALRIFNDTVQSSISMTSIQIG